MIIIKKKSELLENSTKDVVKDVKVTRSHAHNLLGKKFGDYTVIEKDGHDKSGHILWKCECSSCGNTFSTTAYELLNGRKNTCCKHCHPLISAVSDTHQEKKNKAKINKSSNHICTNNDVYYNASEDCFYNCIAKNVYYREIKKDLLSMPIYYHIAHCIPTDLSFYGKTAKRIDSLYNLKDKLRHDSMDTTDIPLCSNILIDNVFTLFPTKEKHNRATIGGAEIILNTLASDCHDMGIKYLAMPRVCCGHNGLKWENVKKMVVSAFSKVYQNNEDEAESPIFITICYN